MIGRGLGGSSGVVSRMMVSRMIVQRRTNGVGLAHGGEAKRVAGYRGGALRNDDRKRLGLVRVTTVSAETERVNLLAVYDPFLFPFLCRESFLFL